jgi:hypothetical protein
MALLHCLRKAFAPLDVLLLVSCVWYPLAGEGLAPWLRNACCCVPISKTLSPWEHFSPMHRITVAASVHLAQRRGCGHPAIAMTEERFWASGHSHRCTVSPSIIIKEKYTVGILYTFEKRMLQGTVAVHSAAAVCSAHGASPLHPKSICSLGRFAVCLLCLVSPGRGGVGSLVTKRVLLCSAFENAFTMGTFLSDAQNHCRSICASSTEERLWASGHCHDRGEVMGIRPFPPLHSITIDHNKRKVYSWHPSYF